MIRRGEKPDPSRLPEAFLGWSIGRPLAMEPRSLERALAGGFGGKGNEKPYSVVDRVALISLVGPMIQRPTWWSEWMGYRAYSSIAEELDQALVDPEVDEILLVVDSPGGECAGAWDLADRIFEARNVKTVRAFATDLACSAGYLLASSASEVHVSQTSMIGSIGVVVARLDWTAANERWGVRVHHIHAGARKIDCDPDAAFSADEAEALQVHVDHYFGMFVSAIERNRGLSAEAITATEADVFIGSRAVELGLADSVTTLDRLLETISMGGAPAAIPEATNAMKNKRKAPKAGEALGTALDEAIEGMVTDDKTRDDIVADLASASGLEVDAVELILSGETNCPAMAELEGFTTVLDVTLDDLVTAAESDGCEYETEEPEAETGAEEEESSASEARRANRKPCSCKKASAQTGDEDMSEIKKLRAELAIKDAALAATQQAEKQRVIDKHTRAGRVVPAMLDAINKASADLTAEELDAMLGKFPVAVHGAPVGSSDSPEHGPEASADALEASRMFGVSIKNLNALGNIRKLRFDGKVQLNSGEVVERSELLGS